MQKARRNGGSRIAFTGGEPTLRSDLPELIRAARKAGFKEIAVTTNGRMFADPQVADELLQAGLNRISFSLHSANQACHDRLSGVPGAFQQLSAGISGMKDLAARNSVDLKLHSVSLLVPETVAEIDRTIILAAELGATIHLVQPFIASRANLHVAQRYFVPQQELAEAVCRAGAAATRMGTRVKPFNIPYCLLSELDGIEVQQYALDTHRRHHLDAQEEGGFGQKQFVRIARCQTCPTPCPGFRIEQASSSSMCDGIYSDTQDMRSSRLILPALDLLPAAALAQLLGRLHADNREVIPLTGGPTFATADEFTEVVSAAGCRTVVHLLRTNWNDPEGLEPDPGNSEELIIRAELLQQAGLESRLLVGFPDLLELPFSPAYLSQMYSRVCVAMPMQWRGVHPNGGLEALFEKSGGRFTAILKHLEESLPVSFVQVENIRILPRSLASWQRTFGQQVESEDWSNQLVRHRYTSSAYNFVMWGNPFWLFK
jgi:pyruvate-formate lyase-activating enzyme